MPYGTRRRADVLEEADRACRRNDGAPGCDGMTFDQIATHGQDRWLEELRQELRDASLSAAAPAGACGYQRAMGVSARLVITASATARVEMATLLVPGPIFEADLLRNQYGFRPGIDAKMAMRTGLPARQRPWAVGKQQMPTPATTFRRSHMGR